MSKNVFRVGDVVYHYSEGEGVVKDVDTSVMPYLVDLKSGESFWNSERTLSFSPWPAPNHTRPIQEGWWLARNITLGEVYLRELREDGWVYDADAYRLHEKDRYEFIRFLGKDWREEA